MICYDFVSALNRAFIFTQVLVQKIRREILCHLNVRVKGVILFSCKKKRKNTDIERHRPGTGNRLPDWT